MQKPVLVIMAAGLGSRFGGLKQMTPIDDAGHVIIDYSMYDAYRAGFSKVICIVKRELEGEFEQLIGRRVRNKLELVYAYQGIDMLPKGYHIPDGRTKPWGTSHAVLCASEQIGDAPFAVINADDFYGASAYSTIFEFLSQPHKPNEYAMVGYLVKNTLSPNGSVSRGVCEADENGMLTSLVERLKIYPRPNGAAYTEDDGKTFTEISGDTIVSMNYFGFMPSMLTALRERFPAFLDDCYVTNPMKGEYLLPRTAGELISEGKATMRVLHSADNWYGVTNREDLPEMKAELAKMKAEGKYPERLWV